MIQYLTFSDEEEEIEDCAAALIHLTRARETIDQMHAEDAQMESSLIPEKLADVLMGSKAA